MSLSGVQSNPWVNPWSQSTPSQSAASGSPFDATSPLQGGFGPTVPNGPWSSQGAAGLTNTAANPFQSLADDLQAMLIQAQGTAASSIKPAATAPAATNALTPEQKLAADLQTLMSDLQSSTSPTQQTANANPATPSGQSQPHHHHHHRGGGDASGASAVAASSGGATGTAASGDQTLSQVLAADITQALQAYGATSASTATSTLTG